MPGKLWPEISALATRRRMPQARSRGQRLSPAQRKNSKPPMRAGIIMTVHDELAGERVHEQLRLNGGSDYGRELAS